VKVLPRTVVKGSPECAWTRLHTVSNVMLMHSRVMGNTGGSSSDQRAHAAEGRCVAGRLLACHEISRLVALCRPLEADYS